MQDKLEVLIPGKKQIDTVSRWMAEPMMMENVPGTNLAVANNVNTEQVRGHGLGDGRVNGHDDPHR